MVRQYILLVKSIRLRSVEKNYQSTPGDASKDIPEMVGSWGLWLTAWTNSWWIQNMMALLGKDQREGVEPDWGSRTQALSLGIVWYPNSSADSPFLLVGRYNVHFCFPTPSVLWRCFWNQKPKSILLPLSPPRYLVIGIKTE